MTQEPSQFTEEETEDTDDRAEPGIPYFQTPIY